MVHGTTNIVVQRKYLPKDHGHDSGGSGQAKTQPCQGIMNTIKPENLILSQVLREMNLQISRYKVHHPQLTFELSPLAHFISKNGYFIVPSMGLNERVQLRVIPYQPHIVRPWLVEQQSGKG